MTRTLHEVPSRVAPLVLALSPSVDSPGWLAVRYEAARALRGGAGAVHKRLVERDGGTAGAPGSVNGVTGAAASPWRKLFRTTSGHLIRHLPQRSIGLATPGWGSADGHATHDAIGPDRKPPARRPATPDAVRSGRDACPRASARMPGYGSGRTAGDSGATCRGDGPSLGDGIP